MAAALSDRSEKRNSRGAGTGTADRASHITISASSGGVSPSRRCGLGRPHPRLLDVLARQPHCYILRFSLSFMAKPVALVTGASSGIGVELARLLAAGRYDLALVARSADRLASVADEIGRATGARVDTYPCDLAAAGGAIALWQRLRADGIAVDALVNNAGSGLHGDFAEQDVEAIDRMVTLNVVALTTLTRLVLPQMLERRRGRVLNVASLAAFQPGGPREAVYYATKSFVLTFSKGLGRELRGTGVTVTALCPGPTRTSFQATAGATNTVLAGFPMDSAAVVARAGWHGMMRGTAVVVPGLVTKLLAFAGQLPPRRLALEVNRLLLRPGSRPH